MKSLRQIVSVTRMNLGAMQGRVGTSLVIIAGMAAVVAVTLSVLSLSSGLVQLVANSAEDDRVIVLGHDAQFEESSTLSRPAIQAIVDTPGIKKNPNGKALVTADVLAYVPSIKKANGLDVFVALRGVSESFFALRPEIHLIEGRMYQPALHELIVGTQVREQFEGYDVGSNLSLQDGDWKVVGVFESDGFWASSLLTDSETMLSAFRRNGYNSVTARLEGSARSYDDFRAMLTTNPALAVDVERETAFFARIFEQRVTLLKVIAYWVGGVMGVGAVFGALNTMYSSVGTRRIEIATLRAIGFGATPVVVSVIIEALLLAAIGAVIGASAAWLAFNGQTHLLGDLSFQLLITPRMFAGGMMLALGVGLVGALFPAIRAARLPVTTALQGAR